MLSDALNQKVDKAIEEYWPQIQKVFQDKVGSVALEAAKNDKACESLFIQVHKQLPLPIRLVIKRDVFVKYCFDNRNKLI